MAKTTTTSRTTAKTTANKSTVTTENIEDVKASAETVNTVPTQTAKKYAPDDLIPCRSVYAGTLLFTGAKTKVTYAFSNIGDFMYVEYQDLLSALLTRKKSLFAPYIIIEDEELLSDVHWKPLRDIYESLYDINDIDDLLNLNTAQFNEEFRKLPVGFRNTVKTEVATRIQEGRFDSMNKIKIIDEVCGTELYLLYK